VDNGRLPIYPIDKIVYTLPMARSSQSDDTKPHIAIIGGGASGTLTAVQLLRRAADLQLALEITLIDRYDRHGLGLAYSTDNPAHLLNATASQMSAFADDPDHLVRWAGTSPAAFLPRHQYGRYLQATLADAEQQAKPWAALTRMTAEVRAVRHDQERRALRLVLADGHLDADLSVLATGAVAAGLPFPAPVSHRIVAEPWLPGALDGITDHSPVVIVGTGLTMFDLAVTIAGRSPGATIHAVSRHGLLPRPHPGVPPAGRPIWLPVITRTTGPVRLSDLMWQVRSAIDVNRANWPDVVDAIRPFIPGLWRRMPDADKRLFLRHVARYWEVHRHLVPPATASTITALRCTGRLAVHRGQISSVALAEDRLRIGVRSGTGESELTAGWLINGTGASTGIGSTTDPLLRDLFASGTARPDPVGLGLAAASDGAVIGPTGAPSDVLYTLGPPLRGLWYETTAIPEIRAQAAALAERIVSKPGVRRLPGSAA
jgi:uncharacterized NAD(P)/FAD-binding protein YdhS